MTEPRGIPEVLLRQPASPPDQSQSDRPLKIAQEDRDHVADLAARHEKTCTEPGCEECQSLAAHVARTERQVALLTPPDYETESLF